MAYSEYNEKCTKVLKLIKKWKGYTVLVNLPYVKGVHIVQKLKGGKFRLLQKFTSNFEAVQAMGTPNWHPDPQLISKKIGFFDLKDCVSSKALTKNFISTIQERVYDLKTAGASLGMTKRQLHSLDVYLETINNKFIV